MKKCISLNNKQKIVLNIVDHFCTEYIAITKAYENDGKIEKEINFSIWDDFAFGVYNKNKNIKDKIDFYFDINDPIYFSLSRLLGDKNKLIIDDDDTPQKLQKYMEICRENFLIRITFYNKLQNPLEEKRFGVFIKNTGLDVRSKISDLSLKIRLQNFFKDTKKMLLEESHQYTLDEYYEILKVLKQCNQENPFLYSSKKIRNSNECCRNCEYGISPELVEEIIEENYEYRNMSYEEALKQIGNCEYGIDLEYQMNNNYWCERYLRKM